MSNSHLIDRYDMVSKLEWVAMDAKSDDFKAGIQAAIDEIKKASPGKIDCLNCSYRPETFNIADFYGD